MRRERGGIGREGEGVRGREGEERGEGGRGRATIKIKMDYMKE